MKTPYKHIADRILRNKFGIYGDGNFDLSVDEFAQVLRIAMLEYEEEAVDEELNKYYNEIR